MSAQPHILVLGSGSVGQRHARNFSALGCLISCADPRADRIAQLNDQTPVQRRFNDMEEALAHVGDYDGAVVCAPTAFHLAHAGTALAAGVPVLIEKPLACYADDAQNFVYAVAGATTPVLLGYTWRWWEPLQEIRRLLASGVTGPLRHVRFVMSAHLEDWHPWEHVTDFFMSSRALGGGALLDESHWIDLMLWLFGLPDFVWGQVETIGSLGLETDDHVDAMFHYPDGKRIAMHLDTYGRPHEKSIMFAGELGSIRWSAEPNEIRVGRGAGQEWEVTQFSCERNDMFMGVAKSFLAMLAGSPNYECTVVDGLRVLRVIEALRKSSRERRMVAMSED
jgi:predicted dehydrogenase